MDECSTWDLKWLIFTHVMYLFNQLTGSFKFFLSLKKKVNDTLKCEHLKIATSVYMLILNGVLMNTHLDSTVWVNRHSSFAFVFYSLNLQLQFKCNLFILMINASSKKKEKKNLPFSKLLKQKGSIACVLGVLVFFLLEFSYFLGITWKHGHLQRTQNDLQPADT